MEEGGEANGGGGRGTGLPLEDRSVVSGLSRAAEVLKVDVGKERDKDTELFRRHETSHQNRLHSASREPSPQREATEVCSDCVCWHIGNIAAFLSQGQGQVTFLPAQHHIWI